MDDNRIREIIETNPELAYEEYLEQIGSADLEDVERFQEMYQESMISKMRRELEQTTKAIPMPDYMRYDRHGSKGEGVYCTCGAFKLHNRGKVLARWADKHFDKTGHKWKRT